MNFKNIYCILYSYMIKGNLKIQSYTYKVITESSNDHFNMLPDVR